MPVVHRSEPRPGLRHRRRLGGRQLDSRLRDGAAQERGVQGWNGSAVGLVGGDSQATARPQPAAAWGPEVRGQERVMQRNSRGHTALHL
eukprot:513450-Rhodomonas_salina.2